MSKEKNDSEVDEISAALLDAQKQGLPPNWDLVIDVRDIHQKIKSK